MKIDPKKSTKQHISCLLKKGCHFLFVISVVLPTLSIYVATPGQAETNLDYRALPPFKSTNIKPNVLLILDNSNSMDEDVDGAAVGSAAANSKSEVARNAMETIIDNNNATMRFGLMAYKQTGIQSYNIHNSFYYNEYNGENAPDPPAYNPTGVPTSKDPSSNTKRFPNPTDVGKYIYYDTALPYYNSSNDGNGFCYSTDWTDFDPETCTSTNTASCHTYKCYRKKTGTSVTPAGATDAQLTAAGYSSLFGTYKFHPTDSDIAAGFHEFGREMSWVYVGKAWFANSSPGPGMLHSRIADSDTTHIAELKNLLGQSQFASAVDVPLRNAGLTPLAGTMASAQKYFKGVLPSAEDAKNTAPSSPIQYYCQQNYVVLVTDGLPSVKADGTIGSTADLITELKTKISNLRATPFTLGGTTYNFDIQTFVIGFAIPPELGDKLDELAVAGGTADSAGKALLANNAAELAAKLENVFLQISNKTSSGTASSVISGSRSGEGAVYQSLFYPEYTDKSTAKNKITWAGSVHATFVDTLGRMREDTNKNGILDIVDKIIVFRKLTDKAVVIDKYSLVDSVAEVTEITFPSSTLLANKYIFLNTVSNKYYIWFAVDGSGADPDPAPHDRTAIKVTLAGSDTANDVANKTATALSAFSHTFSVPIPTTNEIIITNKIAGDVTDATPENSGAMINIAHQGAGETTHFDFTAYAEDINYLWNSTPWLNGITDADITTQRNYASADHKRYIFTFIDADQDKVVDTIGTGEQRDFIASSLPTVQSLVDNTNIYPYIPVNSDSKSLPAFVRADAGSIAEITNVTFPAATSLEVTQPTDTAKYFRLNSVGEALYAWFTVDNKGIDPRLADPPEPLLSGATGILIPLLSTDTANDVAIKTAAIINANVAFDVPVPATNIIGITNSMTGNVANASSAATGVTISVVQEGVGGNNIVEFLKLQTQRVINYIRGQDQGTIAINGGPLPAFRSRMLDIDKDGTKETTWRLGDIVYSSPTVVSKPQEALHLLYKDASYGSFADHYKQRRTVLYVGGNDGMLHAFNGGFYEDRFDVYPPLALDNKNDAQFLLQPKDKDGSTISSGYAAHDLGSELWAYIPYNLLPHLYWLTEPNYGHVYYVDLKPRIFDAKIFKEDTDHPGGWGTVLVGGMRFGGGKISVDMNRLDGSVDSIDRTMSSAYFVLDITNPEAPPKVLGEFNFPNLGYTTCYPTVAAIKDKDEASSLNRWFLVFGSGPAEADGSPGKTSGSSLPQAISKQSAKLYVVDLLELVHSDKRVLKTIDTSGALSSNSPWYYQNFTGDKNAFISDPITVDLDLDYRADTVYFGTVSYDSTAVAGQQWGGKLRRIVMDKDVPPITIDPTDPSKWNGDSVLFDLETTLHQPITAAPTVGIDPTGNEWVFFGTGRYFTRDDALITDQEAFYGIKEPRSTVPGPTPTLKNSYPSTPVALTSLYNSTNIEVNAATKLVTGGVAPNVWSGATWGQFVSDTKTKGGWYFNFASDIKDIGERNVSQAALFGDLLTFTTYIPSNDVCEYEGNSYLYGLYYLTGTAPYVPALVDVLLPNPTNHRKRIFLGPGLASKPSIHVGKSDGSTAFVQNSDGSIIPIEEQNPGMTKSGRTAWSYKE